MDTEYADFIKKIKYNDIFNKLDEVTKQKISNFLDKEKSEIQSNIRKQISRHHEEKRAIVLLWNKLCQAIKSILTPKETAKFGMNQFEILKGSLSKMIKESEASDLTKNTGYVPKKLK